MWIMFLKKSAKSGIGFHEKSLAVMILVFIVLGSWGLGNRSFLADEMQIARIRPVRYPAWSR